MAAVIPVMSERVVLDIDLVWDDLGGKRTGPASDSWPGQMPIRHSSLERQSI
jgi:hypothetical protein